jgi:uncharacterized protein
VLRLNVGFLLKEGVGFNREFRFDEAVVQLSDDFAVRNLNGVISLTRTPQGLYAQGDMDASVDHACTRCLTEMEQPLSIHLSELFHFPPENAPEDSLTISDDAHLDLAPVVREDFLIAIPIQAICRSDCRGLCPQCGKNWNEGPCACPDDDIDPRWAGLASLTKEPPPEN